MADDKKIIFSMVGVSKSYPPQKQVLKNIYLSFFYGAKIGIIGLNGSGKSSLLKIIAGIDKSYQGEVVFSPGYSVGYLEQDPQLDPQKTVIEVVREGVQPVMDMLAEFDRVNEAFGDPDVLEDPDKMDALIARQAELQDRLDAADAWNIDSKLERAMDALQCPPDDQPVTTLSGGERRRVALCRLLLQQPDVLLLRAARRQQRCGGTEDHDPFHPSMFFRFLAKSTMSTEPSSAAAIEPIRMAILPRSMSSASVKASESTNSDIVKPMPPRQATARSMRHVAPSGITARRLFTASQLARNMPRGLPISRPKKMPMPTDPASAE